ncbi:longitudinals lacking protein, isoforms A/B/D/L-like [Homalodisca vitripennis]|uniref:longitudinals lacking protein, isoforms A/B/D/L-like n=1 Tax=Homalodisca vitripennis TaxID=197043 RepID=UPI001EEAC809|nr:longitudinals lacking protein, isoforms A/B/D/L-like [Homalodisca vitripennis]
MTGAGLLAMEFAGPYSTVTAVPAKTGRESSAQAQHACAQCGRQYKYVQGLRAHVKYECGKPPSFRCQFCTKAFHLAGNLKKHVMLMHQQSPIPQSVSLQ